MKIARGVNKTDLSGSKRGKGDRFSMNRRTFLKASALTAAALAARSIIRYPENSSLASPQESTEGVITEKWIATSCLNCSTRCAIQVRVVNGKAVQITGNPLSRVSEGEICPGGHIGLQVLYDPIRVSCPWKRANPAKGREVDPNWVPISWNQALSEVSCRLKQLRGRGQPHKLLLLHGLNTISDEDMICRFAQAYSGAEVIVNISASPYHFGKGNFRERMLATRASDNVSIFAFNNLVGGQDELVFDGNSMILDEKGRLIAMLSAARVAIILSLKLPLPKWYGEALILMITSAPA